MTDYCDDDCTCHGLSLVLSPGDPGYDEAVQRALDLIVERDASMARHPANERRQWR
jgi:hypothetical protein